MNRLSALLCALLIIFSFSCQKEITGDVPGTVIDETIQLENVPVQRNVSGIVLDENNNPLPGVIVAGGNKSVITDADGKYLLTEGNFNGKYATLSFVKNNYFRLVKTFTALEGQQCFVEAKLSRRNFIGKVATTGGEIIFSSGEVKLVFPSGAFTGVNGISVTDSISVYGTYINPSSADGSLRMPGNLMGVERPSTVYRLATYGMLAVELTTAIGDRVVIADGKKVDITVQIPPSMSASSPNSIPLWYFDETVGVWVKEGEATKNGNAYTGAVSHFTFWNLDVNLPTAYFKARLLNAADSVPLPYKRHSFEVTSYNQFESFQYTDDAGITEGYMPLDVAVRLRVYRDDFTVALDSIIGPYSGMTDAGDIYVDFGTITPPPPPPPATNANITGTLLNCAGLPVGSGTVTVQVNNNTYTAAVFNGSFDVQVFIQGVSNIIFNSYDSSFNTTGNTITYTATGSMNLGNVFACSNPPAEFISYTLDGSTHSFVRNVDSAFCDRTFAFNRTNIACRRANGSPTVEGYVAFVTGPTTTGGTDTSTILTLHQYTTASTPPLLRIVSFTENYSQYPPAQGVEGWVNGTFRCDFLDESDNPHTIVSYFKMWRRN